MAQGLDLVSSLEGTVRSHGDRAFFGVRRSDGWRWTTYADFARMVDAFRSALAAIGVGPGDRVAVISRNRIEWAVGAYAAFGLGAAVVPMYEAQHAADWRHILSDSGARVCLAADEAIAARVRALGVPALERIVVFDAANDDPLGYASLVAEGARAPRAPIAPDPSAIAEIVYTSGTTGTPKGVLLTHANIVANVDAVLKVVPFDDNTRTLAFLPWAHVFGGDELHGILRVGGSIAICDSVDHLAEQLLEVQPTALFAVPRVWNRIYQGLCARIARSSRIVRALFDAGRRASAKVRRGEALSAAENLELAVARKLVFSKVRARFGGRLEYAVSSAATLAPEVAELIDDLGIVVLEAYGMTESSACATINRPNNRRIGSVGQPIPGVRIAIDPRADSGKREGEGEIVIYGHGVMAGYHALPEETAKVLTPDGGLRTGDLGRLDADGFLYITGRLKELFKLENGKYVAPAPLEERLTLSPLIAQAFVFGVDRPHLVALIVPDTAALRARMAAEHIEVSDDELLAAPAVRSLFEREIEACSKEFRGYERIAAFALLGEEFSADRGTLTPTLKLRRRAVVERYRAQIERLYTPSRESGVAHGLQPG